MSDKPIMLIRVDAGTDIGIGHVMRCIALAQAWSAATSGSAVMLSAELPGLLKQLVEHHKIITKELDAAIGSTADAQITAETAESIGARWIVLDGYKFTSAYAEILTALVKRVLLVDDNLADGRCSADIVVNQNIFAGPTSYSRCEAQVRFLLGPRYAMLRSEFGPWRQWQREVSQDISNVLVTLGGADEANFTEHLIGALDDYRETRLQIKVVVGPAYIHGQSLRRKAAQSAHNVQVIQNPPNMPELMAWGDLLIGAAGSTTLEAAFMGLPCVVGVLADNQLPVEAALVRHGLAVSVGNYVTLEMGDLVDAIANLASDRKKRQSMSVRGREVVDGQGARRIVKHMTVPSLQLRPITWDDRDLLFKWANQPSVRQASFVQDGIDWEQHCNWLKEKLNDASAPMYIGVVDGVPAGVVRYVLEDETAVVSTNVSEQFQGRGVGPVLIASGSQALKECYGINTIDAYVKTGNVASLVAFTTAGFERKGEVTRAGQSAWHLQRRLIETAAILA